MKYALVNPNWTFEKSVYFGCREPHLPIEFGYAQAVLEKEGHEAVIFDAHLEGLSRRDLKERIRYLCADCIVVPTAPTYLFWRCPPPELRIPMQACADLRAATDLLIAVGPHASATPLSTLHKLGADLVLRGEFESVLPRIAAMSRKQWKTLPCAVFADGGDLHCTGQAHETDLSLLPAIHWPDRFIRLHHHHHHRFDSAPRKGPGAEMEASRGCPFQCTFCARGTFRNRYRKKPLQTVTAEMDRLIRQGAAYVYFIDEIFLPDPVLIDALSKRDIPFGIQTRIDLWTPEMLDRLGQAGCVSVEAGLESVSSHGRMAFNKRDLADDEDILNRLIRAKKTIPFVQATLLDGKMETSQTVMAGRKKLLEEGIWVNEPVPVFPYPGSAEYEGRWGSPDENAWERAHAWYLEENESFSDIQDDRPLALPQLEQEGL